LENGNQPNDTTMRRRNFTKPGALAASLASVLPLLGIGSTPLDRSLPGVIIGVTSLQKGFRVGQ
jgi:hypothetical protein